jgi:hypothetical protein
LQKKWQNLPGAKRQIESEAGRLFDLADASRDTYARATNLMREALSAEAVVCVDAKAASSKIENVSRGLRKGSFSEIDNTSSSAYGNTSDNGAGQISDTDFPGSNAAANRACKVVGFSTRSRSTLTGTRSTTQHFGLTEKELQGLIRRYPGGKVFNFEESGSLYSSSGDESTSGSNDQSNRSSRMPKSKHHREAHRLGKVMVGARTIGNSFPSALYQSKL